MQVLPRLTQTLKNIKQEEQNTGSPGPYRLVETNYEGLYVLRQRYTKHKDDKISSVQAIIDDSNLEELADQSWDAASRPFSAATGRSTLTSSWSNSHQMRTGASLHSCS